MNTETRKTPLSEREAEVFRLHRDKRQTYRQIGGQLGVSAERIKQIYHEAKERLADYEANGNDAMSLLPRRVQKVLGYIDISTREQAREAVESGRLRWDDSREGRLRWGDGYLRSLGWTSWIALQYWLGMPRTERRARTPRTLP